ncbi:MULTISPECIES: hypothetical protein [unclassified Pseudonocardia]|nr:MULTISPECIES: hypothetical protein [unclassified Pseudonocardia]
MTAPVSRRCATHPAVLAHLARHREEFWPSRRPHAYHEFCPRF